MNIQGTHPTDEVRISFTLPSGLVLHGADAELYAKAIRLRTEEIESRDRLIASLERRVEALQGDRDLLDWIEKNRIDVKWHLQRNSNTWRIVGAEGAVLATEVGLRTALRKASMPEPDIGRIARQQQPFLEKALAAWCAECDLSVELL